jgi:hypothetical protein
MDDIVVVQEDAPQVLANVTLEDLATRMDMFGEQMNWLCENLQSLFAFVNQVGASGGGIRGLLAATKGGVPAVNSTGVGSTEPASTQYNENDANKGRV